MSDHPIWRVVEAKDVPQEMYEGWPCASGDCYLVVEFQHGEPYRIERGDGGDENAWNLLCAVAELANEAYDRGYEKGRGKS